MSWLVPTLGAGAALIGLLAAYCRYKSPRPLEDITWLILLTKALGRVSKWTKHNIVVADIFEQTCDRDPNKVAMAFEPDRKTDPNATRTEFTWADIDARANQVSHWALAQGIKAGDVVGMMVPNTPDFMFTFLGLNKIGVTASFINTSLRRHQLEHALNVSKAKLFLIHPHFEEHVAEVAASIKDSQFYLLANQTSNKSAGLKPVSAEIASRPKTRPSRELRASFGPKSTAAYIFTSGTTGHAKASKILNVRLLTAGSAFDIICKFTSSDCLCISSPLYHASASNIGFGLWILSGCKLVLVEKFSASNFFRQLVENKCTAFVYVGEMCRYLLHAPKSDYDRQHSIRVAIGNGLRGDVWGPFKERYQLPWISEFYSATESPATLMTMVEKQGSMGRIPLLFKKKWNCLLVKSERENGDLSRDPNTGSCV
eukprot:TRINITY_DN12596_c0_g1_i1.p1 TRINITY_DN12596_c0_g1~~TRINITY_DN12596_c0_g1_i1.p1  ORF type:complete len:428 (-),score=68.69 TRINITY_DN12596_c0_g1_i1:77-1360(-)